jgi:hypothetical protein
MGKSTAPKLPASWLALVAWGSVCLAGNLRAQDRRPLAFFPTGTTKIEKFEAARPTQAFDAANLGGSYLMLVFEPNPSAKVLPCIVRLAPHARVAIRLAAQPGVRSFELRYAVSLSASPFQTRADRYRAFVDGETVMCVPVPSALYIAMRERAASILANSKTLVTDNRMPAGTYIYTPGPFYKAAGLFARDFLYTLQGAGRDLITADEVRQAVEFLALNQLAENRKVGDYTYPKGAIPDHVYPDGRYCWGPGAFYGDNTAHFHRPSMDEAMNFITLAWHYGYKAGWNQEWQTWFRANSQHFMDAWNSVPRNPQSGLVTQWSTPGRLGASGVIETTGPSVMWGFHDSYGFGGDDLGTSVLACNAARALADMYDHISDTASARAWDATADALRDSIRAQFHPAGYLPWGVGAAAPTMASPDITGYAVWSGILSDAQADAASDWFAARYDADKAAGGPADLFNMTGGLRGSVRMARKADDVSPGRHVWPDMTKPHWENLAYGYNAYQDGGYWYYMSLGVAATLWRKHPAEAEEWVANAYNDVIAGGANNPYERIDGVKPVNNRYDASVGPLLGMGMPATVDSVNVTIKVTGGR